MVWNLTIKKPKKYLRILHISIISIKIYEIWDSYACWFYKLKQQTIYKKIIQNKTESIRGIASKHSKCCVVSLVEVIVKLHGNS